MARQQARATVVIAIFVALLTTIAAGVAAQEPSRLATAATAGEPIDVSLETVLARAAAYVAAFQKQLTGIVAEESYVQEARSGAVPDRATGSPVVERRVLKSDFLLVRPGGADAHVEFRDVFQVDGADVRDRQDRLTKLFLEPGNMDRVRAIIEESARYNIGNIPRNVNTPMLALTFLLDSYQHRFRFRRARSSTPALTALRVANHRPDAGVFRATTEMWVIEFDERRRGTVIRTNAGKDFPAAGRFWIDPATGAVLMSELAMNSPYVNAVIDVSYQSEPLLGFRVPAEMREQYRARSDSVEGVATYGRFRQFQVRTGEDIALPPVKPPDKTPPKPPGAS
jgi:hypothetical protein